MGIIARDSVGHPALGVIQHEGICGPDALYHAYMLSWACFRAAKRGRLTAPVVLSDDWFREAKPYYDALKNMHYEYLIAMNTRGNTMPVHPRRFLNEIIRNHIAAAQFFGYEGIESQ